MSIKDKLKNNKIVSSIYYRSGCKKLKGAITQSSLSAAELSKFTHYELYCTKVYGIDKFNSYAQRVHGLALNSIAKKEKIKIGFVVYSSAMWSCEKIYKLFEADEQFEPFIIVGTLKTNSAAADREVYENSLKYFTDKGYKTIATKGQESEPLKSFGNPDILFYLTPYTTAYTPQCFNISKIPLDKLCVYIPYSIIVSGTQKLFFNSTINLAWRFFCESRSYLTLMQQKAELGGKNTVYTGFPGMDSLLEGKSIGLFKGEKSLKKIIYAPHFSVGDSGICFSTFHQNFKFMLELAKKTESSVSWVIKPHPRLKSECVKCGVFNTEKEFDEYIAQWDALPNAKSMFGGGYNNLFAESDAIILDSASFLVEYQFTGNPLLFLTKTTQSFNPFGQSVLNTAHKADGTDYQAIESFVFETVINGSDSMKAKRKEFFDTELNYIEHNGGLTASEKIYSIIRSEIDANKNH